VGDVQGDGAAGLLPFAVGAAPAGCDVGRGEWVRDEAARPWYREWECPYIQPQLTCQAHGRPDKGYQSWRWQPRGCSLPRYVRSRPPSLPPSPRRRGLRGIHRHLHLFLSHSVAA
jgi:hypothetical protein